MDEQSLEIYQRNYPWQNDELLLWWEEMNAHLCFMLMEQEIMTFFIIKPSERPSFYRWN